MKIKVKNHKVGNIPLLEVVADIKENEILPTIVYYHGWHMSKELVLTQGRYLANEGFRVLLPDAINHGERRQELSPIPSLSFWQAIHTNIAEFSFIIQTFRDKGLTGKKIGVGGLSMGGFTTCMLLTHHPEIQVAVCAMGTPSPLKYRKHLENEAKHQGLTLPGDYEDLTCWIEKYDLSKRPEVIGRRHVLFWHGTEDERVPYEDTASFIQKQHNPNVQFISKKEGHFVSMETIELIAKYFSDHLK